jgi:hypothetical protein
MRPLEWGDFAGREPTIQAGSSGTCDQFTGTSSIPAPNERSISGGIPDRTTENTAESEDFRFLAHRPHQ